jgi:hypothetical protein
MACGLGYLPSPIIALLFERRVQQQIHRRRSLVLLDETLAKMSRCELEGGRIVRGNQALMKASSSGLMISGCVVHTPCGSPGYTFNVAFLTSFAASGAQSAIGTT